MASTALANLAKGTRGPNRGQYIGAPNVTYAAKKKGLKNARIPRVAYVPRSSGMKGMHEYSAGEFGRPPKKFKTVSNTVKGLPRTQKIRDFARGANLTAGVNLANILNKIAHWGQPESKIVPGVSKMVVAKTYAIIGAGAVGAGAATAGAVYIGRRATPGGRAVADYKKKQKIAKKNGKAALKAQKMNEKQKLRSGKAVKPMKGATGRGAPTGKKGQSGGGRKNFRPRRDGNGKFAGSY